MPEYVSFPLVTSQDDLETLAYQYLQAKVPGWEPTVGSLDVWIIEALALWAADLRQAVTEVTSDIFRYFGANLMGIPPVDASAAVGFATLTARDTQGYTLPDGTLVGFTGSDGTVFPFYTVGDVVLAPGSAVSVAGAVTLRAQIEGAASSGLGNSGVALDLLDPIDWVTSIVLTGTTTGGADAETDDDYLNRLTGQLQLMTPRPILPNDFAALAVTIPGIARALAVDGYDPVSNTYNNPRVVAIASIDGSGNPVSTVLKAQVQTYLDSLREVNFVVNTIDPTVTAVDVTYTAQSLPGRDTSLINSLIVSALQSFLSSANWGLNQAAPGGWIPQSTVRLYEIATVINNVDGVDYITDLRVGLNGGAQAATDYILSGAAPLATPGTISGSVS
jgi:uncharacterized phage protein gp47/JayE